MIEPVLMVRAVEGGAQSRWLAGTAGNAKALACSGLSRNFDRQLSRGAPHQLFAASPNDDWAFLPFVALLLSCLLAFGDDNPPWVWVPQLKAATSHEYGDRTLSLACFAQLCFLRTSAMDGTSRSRAPASRQTPCR